MTARSAPPRSAFSSGLHQIVPGMRALAAALLIVVSATTLRADDYLNRVNAAFKGIADAKRSDLVLLPLLAKMDEAPAELRDTEFAMLVTPSHPAWETILAWASAEPQKALLNALKNVTNEEDFRTAMVFAQGYGVEAVSSHPELIAANMYTELGDPPTLAAARHGYLPALSKLEILSHIDATRLLSAGDAKGAIESLFNFMYFTRQMCDRPFLTEKQWAMTALRSSLTRLRDLAYQDSRSETKSLTYTDIRDWVRRIDPERGYLSIERIRLPEASFIAAEQLVTRVVPKGGGFSAGEFSTTLAKIAAADRPLRLLSESARWQRAHREHSDYWQSMDTLMGPKGDGGVRSDWLRRWDLGTFDPLLRRPSEYSTKVAKAPKFAVLQLPLNGVDELFALRMSIRAELAGTRVGLSIYGYSLQSNGSWPRDITAIRPFYMDKVDLDPYNSRSQNRLEFFVPVRDRPAQGTRGEEIPFEVRVFLVTNRKNFSLKLRADTFVLYSVGPNESDDLGKDATQDDTSGEGDYLMWPPALSLVRKYLADSGQQP